MRNNAIQRSGVLSHRPSPYHESPPADRKRYPTEIRVYLTMIPANPYAPPGFIKNHSDSTCIEWDGRKIEIRGAAIARRLWSIIEYTVTIDSNEMFSNTQIRGTDDFRWHFKHKGRVADACFEPIGWQHYGRQQFRIHIDGDEIAFGTLAVRAFGCWSFLYMLVILVVIVGAPGALIALLAHFGS